MSVGNSLGTSFATYIPIIANRRRMPFANANEKKECRGDRMNGPDEGFRDPANSRVLKRHSSKASASALRVALERPLVCLCAREN